MSTQSLNLDGWIQELRITKAPATLAGLQVALRFFDGQMPELPRKLRVAFLRGMDLSKPVRTVQLVPPERVIAYRKCNEDPLKLFYTRPGTAVQQLGLNPQARRHVSFQVRSAVTALESRAAPARDTWTDEQNPVLSAGGGLQYIVAQAPRVLVVA